MNKKRYDNNVSSNRDCQQEDRNYKKETNGNSEAESMIT